MINNASLQELKEFYVPAGSALVMLKSLEGCQYKLVERDGRTYVAWQRGDRLGGMQGVESFAKSLEMQETNMENALKKTIRIGESEETKELTNAEIVYSKYEGASDEARANCDEQVSRLGNSTLSFAHGQVVGLYERNKTATYQNIK